MDAFKHKLHSAFKEGVNAILPTRRESAFFERGVLSPEEFVAAGDFLVRACPTWRWQSGDARKRYDFLPQDKQFLMTTNVPSTRRAADVERSTAHETLIQFGNDEWVETHAAATTGADAASVDDVLDLDAHEASASHASSSLPPPPPPPSSSSSQPPIIKSQKEEEYDDIPDLDELDLGHDPSCLPSHPHPSTSTTSTTSHPHTSSSNILKTRTYDLHITYDKYYQTPRFWLVGYDELHRPLSQAAVLQDVSEEHARKTITLDPHPHLVNVSAAYIHPCRHAEVMKRLVDNTLESGREVRVEHYLIIFLKFIASVVPTIEYDYTMAAGM